MPRILQALGGHLGSADRAREDLEGSSTEPRLFSSQTDVEESSDGEQEKKKSRERASPTLVDSLALCYMGVMLLRMSLSLGDFYRYEKGY